MGSAPQRQDPPNARCAASAHKHRRRPSACASRMASTRTSLGPSCPGPRRNPALPKKRRCHYLAKRRSQHHRQQMGLYFELVPQQPVAAALKNFHRALAHQNRRALRARRSCTRRRRCLARPTSPSGRRRPQRPRRTPDPSRLRWNPVPRWTRPRRSWPSRRMCGPPAHPQGCSREPTLCPRCAASSSRIGRNALSRMLPRSFPCPRASKRPTRRVPLRRRPAESRRSSARGRRWVPTPCWRCCPRRGGSGTSRPRPSTS
mmetsp:Transcript_98481/g.301295  ORF Transcript_98481/g.301295 Transcript_98481/m.301295 type:complete len:260 (+) Transcript_98481:266-1045(+)